MKIKIKVTRDILVKSAHCLKDAGFNCPISLAVREIFPNAWVTPETILPNASEELVKQARVSITSIDELYKGKTISLPLIASKFIIKFDDSNPTERVLMEPISFDIDVPNEVIEEIGISSVYKILSESKTLELVNI